MQREVLGESPTVAQSAFVSEMAYLVGDVRVGERSSCWPFVCLRGDREAVVVGDETNVQEFSMLHGATLGDGVTVGHNVVIDYATVEDGALVGMSSTLQQGAHVESGSIVAPGCVVTEDQTVPAGHVAYGVPASTQPLDEAQQAEIERVHELYVDHTATYKAAGLE
ncbi:gamma carbonic anhydrase family protein [Haloarcula salinisoli]|uniref:Gamma carbonic anhydrase family protein n=1 Tax=Haloarcula salinisoli TaxID=2487746 RepID=A0A8J8CD65_9EURY|nr:gamma carbonic anhydrase family protein [Halomicroarcula salinisoli]MBX0305998.1 gamma carbonic anhydrase family protein [Halomicroarcula salinisoli]